MIHVPMKVSMKARNERIKSSLRLNILLRKFKSLFRSEPREVFPRKLTVLHAVQVEDNERALIADGINFCHSREKLPKVNIQNLIKKRKKTKIKSRYVVPLFCVREIIN